MGDHHSVKNSIRKDENHWLRRRKLEDQKFSYPQLSNELQEVLGCVKLCLKNTIKLVSRLPHLATPLTWVSVLPAFGCSLLERWNVGSVTYPMPLPPG